jgi:hypothetical protein
MAEQPVAANNTEVALTAQEAVLGARLATAKARLGRLRAALNEIQYDARFPADCADTVLYSIEQRAARALHQRKPVTPIEFDPDWDWLA